jgi:hypothetical protein
MGIIEMKPTRREGPKPAWLLWSAKRQEADVCPCSSPTVAFNLEMAFLGSSPIVEGVGKAVSSAKVYFLYVPREPRPA